MSKDDSEPDFLFAPDTSEKDAVDVARLAVDLSRYADTCECITCKFLRAIGEANDQRRAK